MLVEGEESPQIDLNFFRGHLPAGFPIMISILVEDTGNLLNLAEDTLSRFLL